MFGVESTPPIDVNVLLSTSDVKGVVGFTRHDDIRRAFAFYPGGIIPAGEPMLFFGQVVPGVLRFGEPRDLLCARSGTAGLVIERLAQHVTELVCESDRGLS